MLLLLLLLLILLLLLLCFVDADSGDDEDNVEAGRIVVYVIFLDAPLVPAAAEVVVVAVVECQ